MNNKYRELPAFETNEFKPGDKIQSYDSREELDGIFTVKHVFKKLIEVEERQEWVLHFKQCRKLEEIVPKEFWINPNSESSDIIKCNPRFYGYIKVREVIGDG